MCHIQSPDRNLNRTFWMSRPNSVVVAEMEATESCEINQIKRAPILPFLNAFPSVFRIQQALPHTFRELLLCLYKILCIPTMQLAFGTIYTHACGYICTHPHTYGYKSTFAKFLGTCQYSSHTSWSQHQSCMRKNFPSYMQKQKPVNNFYMKNQNTPTFKSDPQNLSLISQRGDPKMSKTIQEVQSLKDKTNGAGFLQENSTQKNPCPLYTLPFPRLITRRKMYQQIGVDDGQYGNAQLFSQVPGHDTHSCVLR